MKRYPKAKLKSTPRKKPPCCNPDCHSHGVEYCRGLCELCYRSLRRLIEIKKLLTWTDAEERGLCRTIRPFSARRFPLVTAAGNGSSQNGQNGHTARNGAKAK